MVTEPNQCPPSPEMDRNLTLVENGSQLKKAEPKLFHFLDLQNKINIAIADCPLHFIS